MAGVVANAAPRLMRRGRSKSLSIYTFSPSSIVRNRSYSPSVLHLPLKIPRFDCRFFCRFPSPFRRIPACKATGSESGVVKGFEELKSREDRSNGLQKQGEEMTIATSVRISADRRLDVRGFTLLSGVPANVTLTSASDSSPIDGVFIGAHFLQPACRHVVSLGTLRDVRFTACFRFKLWWMSQRMGNRGRDIPLETQFLLLEMKNDSSSEILYSVFLPLIDGSFRSSLHGGARDELELCIESGDAVTAAESFSAAAFLTAGHSDPFAAISGAIAAARSHLQTFRLREEKKIPPIVDLFGWCTWDAFYQEVTQEGVESGLQTLAEGGLPPKFVIIDDGWQSVDAEEEDPKPPLMRLAAIKENSKFQNKATPEEGIKSIVNVAKQRYGLSHVYVWHAITGYWGGVRPSAKGMENYSPAMKYPQVSPGVKDNEPGMKTDPLTVHGLGLVDPKKVYQFYDELHTYLARAGVDGVKVDVQSILETLGGGFGGRVELTRMYHQALDASVKKNFPDNGIIACMSHSSDALYHSKQTAVVRASDDFYPRDPVSHTIHIASVAYNSVFLGEFMVPDWDMFHSLHPAAEYHASARAISGGPVYVSDAPGKHNFELLKKLVLPDGSILRARLPGRPTKDCLFTDPTRDGVSLLKIWNMNKYTGVVGIYNCQGAAWCKAEKKNLFHHTQADSLTCTLRVSDVHLISEATADENWNGDCAVYKHGGCGVATLAVLPKHAAMPVSLKILQHELFIVAPIKVFSPELKLAPLGLVDMFNGGGAIAGLKYGGSAATVFMEVKGCGRFGAYSSSNPRKCTVGSSNAEFSFDSSSGLLLINLDEMPGGDNKVHSIVIDL